MSIRTIAMAGSIATGLMLSIPALADGPAPSHEGRGHENHGERRCHSGPFAGSYVGLTAGYIQSDSDHLTRPWTGHSETANKGFGSGAFIGQNWQCNMLVLGFEGDINFGDVKTTAVYPDAVLSSSVDWYSTIRGRFGVTDDDFMVYLTGGLAYGGITQTISAPNFGLSQSNGSFGLGFAVGAGFELSRDRWSLRAESLYVSLGSNDANYPTTLNHRSTLWDDHFWTLRGGISLKLGHFEKQIE